ncbi:MAG: Ig-like domain-containing protein [Clostridiales bacterium]|nr:Ig-like domain-containing protein [Clostridiales bacterium]
MTKTRKILAIVIAALMILAVIPAAALAEDAAYEARERKAMKRWDDVWAVLDAVEAEMMELGASRSEVTFAVYKAALNLDLIDEGSITDLTGNEFSFTTDGMLGGYNYRIRNHEKVGGDMAGVDTESAVSEAVRGNCPSAKDVLLVGPYYGSDSSFTDQYKNEAKSIAQATGGTVTTLSGAQATGPNIAKNYTGKGVVIYDSHGNCIASQNTSYLDLTTGTGLTSDDYSKGWAYNGGSFYGIDGRYIQNHADGRLSNCFVWMAICQGMMKEGQGTTGTALLEAGAACVYGYSQSVSFTGDYKYEATFWTEMKNGATVAEAIAKMKSTNGVSDPYTNPSAWPIVMSPTDAFPANPDGRQTVTCDWTLLGDPEPIESVSLAPITMYEGTTERAKLTVEPGYADYSVTWSSLNPSVVSISDTGVVTALRPGTATIEAIVHDNLANAEFTATALVTVEAFEGYLATDTIALGDKIAIVASGMAVGNTVYNDREDGHYVTSVPVTENEDNTLTVAEENMDAVVYTVTAGSESEGWVLKNEATGKYLCLTSDEYLTVGNTELKWLFDGSSLNNQIDSEGYYYIALSSNTEYFTTSRVAGALRIYKYFKSAGTDPQPTLKGDIDGNGKVEAADALLALRYSMNIIGAEGLDLTAGDMDDNGTVDAVDALLILRKSMGIIE